MCVNTLIWKKTYLQSSRLEVFCKKGVHKTFVEFTGKHLCQSIFLNKVAGLRHPDMLKKTLIQVFSSEFWEIFRNTFFIEHFRWLLVWYYCIITATQSRDLVQVISLHYRVRYYWVNRLSIAISTVLKYSGMFETTLCPNLSWIN